MPLFKHTQSYTKALYRLTLNHILFSQFLDYPDWFELLQLGGKHRQTLAIVFIVSQRPIITVSLPFIILIVCATTWVWACVCVYLHVFKLVQGFWVCHIDWEDAGASRVCIECPHVCICVSLNKFVFMPYLCARVVIFVCIQIKAAVKLIAIVRQVEILTKISADTDWQLTLTTKITLRLLIFINIFPSCSNLNNIK